MPYTDPIVLALLIVSLLSSLVFLWRRGLRHGRLAIMSFGMFYGLSTISAPPDQNTPMLQDAAYG